MVTGRVYKGATITLLHTPVQACQIGGLPGQPTWSTLAPIAPYDVVLYSFHTKMTTPNLGSLPVNPKGILQPESTVGSQLGFSVVNHSDITISRTTLKNSLDD